MPTIIKNPTKIETFGNKPKIIKEFVGGVNSSHENISIAKMQSPAGWEEPGQTPEFDEYSLVLKGVLQVETKSGIYDIKADEAIITHKGEWVKYSTPNQDTEYIAICLPAFSPKTVHRDV